MTLRNPGSGCPRVSVDAGQGWAGAGGCVPVTGWTQHETACWRTLRKASKSSAESGRRPEGGSQSPAHWWCSLKCLSANERLFKNRTGTQRANPRLLVEETRSTLPFPGVGGQGSRRSRDTASREPLKGGGAGVMFLTGCLLPSEPNMEHVKNPTRGGKSWLVGMGFSFFFLMLYKAYKIQDRNHL